MKFLSSHALLSVVVLLYLLPISYRVFGQDSPQSLPPPSSIRVDVNLVNVGVTVTDIHGNAVQGLKAEDFQVFDNGVRQPIRNFLSNEEQSQVVLMMESGPAAFFLKNTERQAAEKLVGALAPADQLAILTYSSSPRLLLDFTTSRAEARAAIESISFRSGSLELNLASNIVVVLDWLATLPGKKTVVLLSSGVDSATQANWETVQQKVRTSDVRILAVSIARDFRKFEKHKKLSPDEREQRNLVIKQFAEADQALRQLATATGGRVYFPRDEKDFAHAYTEITQFVGNDYSLAFAPSTFDGQLHSLKVKVKRAWCRVESRQAYLAPPAISPNSP